MAMLIEAPRELTTVIMARDSQWADALTKDKP
jgi:hypothetical protein